MTISTYRAAKKKFEQIGFNPKKGNYAQLTNSYLGDLPYLGAKEKEALRNIFIKFADLQDKLNHEQVKFKIINVFINNLLCLAQIYYRFEKNKMKRGDTDLFSKVIDNIKTIIDGYERIKGKESDTDYRFIILEIENAVDELKCPVVVQENHTNDSHEITPQDTTDVLMFELKGKTLDPRIILGLTFILIATASITLSLSLATDLLPHLDKIWSSDNPDRIAKATATAVPTLLLLPAATQTPKVIHAYSSLMRP